MTKSQNNKDFIVRYFNAFSGKVKTAEMCDEFMTDEVLKEHVVFFEAIFPKYEIFADEMTSEHDRIVVRARLKGRHEGEFNGIPPTYRTIEMPFAIMYTIKNGKIVDHWLIADQVSLMEQLGVMEPAAH